MDKFVQTVRPGVGLNVLAGQGAAMDTTMANGKLVFGIFAALAEFELALISERTRAGLAAARARGRNGGRPPALKPATLRMLARAMADPMTEVAELCREQGISKQTLYRYLSPRGDLRPAGIKLLQDTPKRS